MPIITLIGRTGFKVRSAHSPPGTTVLDDFIKHRKKERVAKAVAKIRQVLLFLFFISAYTAGKA